MIAHNVIDRNTDRESNATIDWLSIDFLRKQLLGLSCYDCVPKFAKIDNFSPRNTLTHKTLKSQVDNLGSLLILGADVTVKAKMQVYEVSERLKSKQRFIAMGLYASVPKYGPLQAEQLLDEIPA